jgi:hypothetical protein
MGRLPKLPLPVTVWSGPMCRMSPLLAASSDVPFRL